MITSIGNSGWNTSESFPSDFVKTLATTVTRALTCGVTLRSGLNHFRHSLRARGREAPRVGERQLQPVYSILREMHLNNCSHPRLPPINLSTHWRTPADHPKPFVGSVGVRASRGIQRPA